MYIDTHAHYNLPAFADDRDKVLEDVRAAGVDRILCPAIGFDSNAQMMECLGQHGDIHFALGIHPKHVYAAPKDKRAERTPARLSRLRSSLEEQAGALERLEEMLGHLRRLATSGMRVVAIGETGLDYSRNPSEFERKVQKAVFREHVEMALTAKLPLVLHIRDAHRDAAQILHGYRCRFSGSVHSFCLGVAEAKEYLAMGLSLGIGGKLTYEQYAGLREAVATVPLESILLETDAPYVVPATFGSRRNDSTAIPIIAREVARLRGISAEEVARATTQNAMRVFFGASRPQTHPVA